MNANKKLESIVIEFIKNIAEKYDINLKDLENMWRERSETIKKSEKSEKSESKITGKCEYVFVKGDKKGTTCSSKTKDGNLCSKHKGKTSSDAKKKSPKKAGPLQPVTKNIILRRNKDIGNKLWHPETRLVFKSTRDKIVIGKANDSNQIIQLNDDDIEVCKSMGFVFDKNGSSLTTDDDASHKKPKITKVKPIKEETPKEQVKPVKETPKEQVKPVKETPKEQVKSVKETPKEQVKPVKEEKKPKEQVKSVKETPIQAKPDISTTLTLIRKNKKTDDDEDNDDDDDDDDESILESEDSD